MPLFKGKSKEAFKKNVKAEMHEGKPQKQALAIAYSMKKKAKKMSKGGNPYSKMEESTRPNMASGGTVESGDPEMNYSRGGVAGGHKQEKELQAKRGESYGAETVGVHSPSHSSGRDKGQSFAGDAIRYAPAHRKQEGIENAKQEHKSNLAELKSMKGPHGNYADGGDVVEETPEQAGSAPEGPSDGPVSKEEADKFKKGANFAHGGYIGSYQSPDHECCNHPSHKAFSAEEMAGGFAAETDPMSAPTHQGLTDSGYQGPQHEMDMIRRALHQRKMSKGGQVANSDEPLADFLPNEFDELHLEDNLEQHDTGANSGDEDGDQRSHEKDDLVARAMLRKKAKR